MNPDDEGIEQKFRTVVDKVGASKAGHAYHEAWAARSTLELLNPATNLVAIAMEGFTAADETDLDSAAVEIADLTRYYGASDVGSADRVEIVQFKYSIAKSDTAVRAADLAGTLAKFAATDAQLRKRHGDERIDHVVRYEFVTNRPLHPNLLEAAARVIDGGKASGDVDKQRRQLLKAVEACPHSPAGFFERLSLLGKGGTLAEANRLVARTLASWSEADDLEAETRLLKLRNLVREKAGLRNQNDKKIARVTVLGELGIEHESVLYPTPDAFPQVDLMIDREAVPAAEALARSDGLPLVVHGAGGMGKTVLMQSLARRLAADNHVVVFDGFGAGRWRDLSDGRHRPQRTLVHLANIMAGSGLCDIVLPMADETSLLRAFRRRLAQAVTTGRRQRPGSCIVLVLDAIDHAAEAARDTRSTSFAHLILNTLSVEPIDGVIVIASCRSERRAKAVGGAEHRDFEVPPFTEGEARQLIKLTAPDASAVDASALIARSGRNPRCLAELLDEGPPYDVKSSPGASPAIVLDTLLEQRLAKARMNARQRGVADDDLNLLLAGLALLPPPVPFEELAAAHGVTTAQVESFAADLAPLLERTSNAERTSYGLMFRDEPTETLIRSATTLDAASRRRVLDALSERQSQSNYAARALPSILTALGETDRLITLAFDKRVPAGTSRVGQRDIRIARLTSAIAAAAKSSRRDDLFRLMLEAAIVAAGHERSDRFLYEFPDLVAISGDEEALRRLNATKCGWTGGKHAALALAYALRGDTDEALRQSRRAIEWHNWSVSRQDRMTSRRGQASPSLDETGFAYVEMFAGNEDRVAAFFANKNEDDAYAAFAQLFDLLERDKGLAAASEPPAKLLLQADVQSRPLWTAALRFSRGDDEADRRFVDCLAASTPEAASTESLRIRVASSVIRALQLGMRAEAKAILDAGIKGLPELYDFTGQWSSRGKASTAVVIASLRATLSRRPVGLIDLAPKDLRDLVAPSALKRGPSAFAEAVNAKLTEPDGPARASKRARRSEIESEATRELRNGYSHRILPLIPHAQAIANMILPPAGRTGAEMLGAALDQLFKAADSASDYPYHDGKSYMAREGFTAIFEAADALGLIDGPFASRIVAWLAAAPGFRIDEKIAIVGRLSRVEGCGSAALQLAGHAEQLIKQDTDISSRISSYGDLARAVWRVSRDESAAYFKRTLEFADAVGSEDFDRTNSLLELAGHYKGPELSRKASYALVRTLELNQGEDDRFPWIEYARAVVLAAGLSILPAVSRLDDRRKANLRYSLGPALTVLVSSRKLSGSLALCLFGLSTPGESWTWHLSHFVEEVVRDVPREKLENVFETLLIEIDRDDQLHPLSETIDELLEIARRCLNASSPSLKRLEGFALRQGPRNAARTRDPPAPVAAQVQAPILDSDEIDRAILDAEPGEFGKHTTRTVLEDLISRLVNPSDRLRFVCGVVAARVPRLSDKLYALGDVLGSWAGLSASLHDALPDLGLQLARNHAQELVRHGSEEYLGWRDLKKTFRCSHADLVEQAVISLNGVAGEIGGDSWLRLAAKLAPFVSSPRFSEAFESFLETSGDTIPDEVGDGPWCDRLATAREQEEAAAGLIWMRLGHPSAAARWRAAHAVLRLEVMGLTDVIDRVVRRFAMASADPFNDAKLPFYPMHAQLWLLIALARLAKRNPAFVARHRALLESVAFSTDFPHVVMRAFAGQALSAIASILAPPDQEGLLAQVAAINISPFPKTKSRHRPMGGRYAKRPKGSPEPADAFHLDYEFNKSQTEDLCRVFACNGWQVEDAMTAWVRRWDSDVTGMHACPRKSRYDYDYGSSGSSPAEDRYGGYLAWHAFMLVAGEMLAVRRVVEQSWDRDPFANLLNEHCLSRSDGHWLAEATDLFPLDLPKVDDLAMPAENSRQAAREDSRLLLPWAGVTAEKAAADWIPVYGDWSIVRHLNVSMRSVLADRNDAEAITMAWLSEGQFHRWLPSSEGDIARELRDATHSVRSWIAGIEHSDRRLDRNDPYACSQALGRASPAPWIQEVLQIHAEDWSLRRWLDRSGTVFRAEAWGAAGGRGENAWELSGDRLSISRSQLLGLLADTGLVFIGAFKSTKYTEIQANQRDRRKDPFSHRSVIFTLDAKGSVTVPTSLSRKARLALGRLDKDDLRGFDSRFMAIRTALAK